MADTTTIDDQTSAAVDDISTGCFGVIIITLLVSALTLFGLVSAVRAFSH